MQIAKIALEYQSWIIIKLAGNFGNLLHIVRHAMATVRNFNGDQNN